MYTEGEILKAYGYDKHGNFVPIEQTEAFHKAMKEAGEKISQELCDLSLKEMDESLNRLEDKLKNNE